MHRGEDCAGGLAQSVMHEEGSEDDFTFVGLDMQARADGTGTATGQGIESQRVNWIARASMGEPSLPRKV